MIDLICNQNSIRQLHHSNNVSEVKKRETQSEKCVLPYYVLEGAVQFSIDVFIALLLFPFKIANSA